MKSYNDLKSLANVIRTSCGVKCQANFLIALAPANDPYYMGTPADVENAKWFGRIWEQMGLTGKTGVHLRRVHYQIVSQKSPVPMPNGKPYENTEECWDFLSQASKCARYLEVVDATAFVDRRNPDPHIFFSPPENHCFIDVTDPTYWDRFTFPSMPEEPCYTLRNAQWDSGFDLYMPAQRYHLEIWCEKSTMNDVLLPLCQRYGVNLVTGLGEQSISSTIQLVQRACQHQKPVRVFYVSDFDPAGKTMPVSVARKAEYYLEKLCPEIDFRLYPVILTEDQVREYRLPRIPIKESERRKNHFEETYGAGATELDALQALYPGELATILTAYIETYRDDALEDRTQEVHAAMRADFEDVQTRIAGEFENEIAALQSEYEELARDYTEKMAGFQNRLKEVWQAIRVRLAEEKPDLADYPLPEAEAAEEPAAPLFDSTRSYEEQLLVYKAFQGKEIAPDLAALLIGGIAE